MNCVKKIVVLIVLLGISNNSSHVFGVGRFRRWFGGGPVDPIEQLGKDAQRAEAAKRAAAASTARVETGIGGIEEKLGEIKKVLDIEKPPQRQTVKPTKRPAISPNEVVERNARMAGEAKRLAEEKSRKEAENLERLARIARGEDPGELQPSTRSTAQPASPSSVRRVQTPGRRQAPVQTPPKATPIGSPVMVNLTGLVTGLYGEITSFVDPFLGKEFKDNLPPAFLVAMNMIIHFYVIKQFADGLIPVVSYLFKSHYPKKYNPTLATYLYYSTLFVGAILVHYLGSKIVNKMFRLKFLSDPQKQVYRPLVMNLIAPTLIRLAILINDFTRTRNFKNKKIIAYAFAMTLIGFIPQITQAGLQALQD